jgi:hypothetical protein
MALMMRRLTGRLHSRAQKTSQSSCLYDVSEREKERSFIDNHEVTEGQ